MTSNTTARTGFSLVELLVVVSVVALLIALLLPALGAAKETARQSVCQGHQRQLNLAMVAYANDHQDIVTMSLNDPDLKGYLPAKTPGTSNGAGVDIHYRGCPSKGPDEPATGWGGRSFGTTGTVYGGWSWSVENGYLPLRMARVRKPSVTAVGGDCYTVRIVDPGQHERNTLYLGRHRGIGLNFWFFDGHGKFFRGNEPNHATLEYPNAQWRQVPGSHAQFGNSLPLCSFNGCFWHAHG